jgi:hypothetical protein
MVNKLIFGHKIVLKPILMSLCSISSEYNVSKLNDLHKKLEENTEQRKVLVCLMAKDYLEPAVYNEGNNELLQ